MKRLSKESAEKATEIRNEIIASTNNVLSEEVVKKLALRIAIMLDYQAEEVFGKYGLGYMGAAIARNDYSKSSLGKFWKEVKHQIEFNFI